ncbi:MAG TPA: CHAP domain-containing protein, partial [Pilimelia sp.]|nr:CHAP domain-containing protein [Pilimelia sp.]
MIVRPVRAARPVAALAGVLLSAGGVAAAGTDRPAPPGAAVGSAAVPAAAPAAPSAAVPAVASTAGSPAGVPARIDTSEAGATANLRAGPGTHYDRVGGVADGALVRIVCTTSTQPIEGPRGASTLWNRLSDGTWVTHALVEAVAGRRVAAECAPTGRRPQGDDYPYRQSLPAEDRWWMTPRQCTSFVSWRMEQLNGYFHNHMWRHGVSGGWGDAGDWDRNARWLGFAVDNTPRVGAIAQWDPG